MNIDFFNKLNIKNDMIIQFYVIKNNNVSKVL